MKNVIHGFSLLLIFVITAAFLISCENDYPESIYNPNSTFKPNPVINAVLPEFGLAGIDTLEIQGSNFSSVAEENLVYFNGVKATVISATPNSIKAQAPNVPADSVYIKVSVPGALEFAESSPIRLELAAIEYGEFSDFDDGSALSCDANENLYVAFSNKKIMKVTPEGVKTEFGTIPFFIAYGMKVGWEGALFVLRGNTRIYRIPPEGGSASVFTKVKGRVYDLDFDSNGILYAVGKGDSIFSVKSDESSFGSAAYIDFNMVSLRVFDGYVYVTGEYTGNETGIPKQAIWRNQIISTNGELGPNELVFDWTNYAGEFGPSIKSMVISAKGDIYLGLDKEQAIMIYSPSTGNVNPLYPGVIFPPAEFMCWGPSNYLYVNRHNLDDFSQRRIMRYTMKVASAPYYTGQ